MGTDGDQLVVRAQPLQRNLDVLTIALHGRVIHAVIHVLADDSRRCGDGFQDGRMPPGTMVLTYRLRGRQVPARA